MDINRRLLIEQEDWGNTYSHLEATLIEKVKQGDDVKLTERELYWQYQLRTFKENGGNAMNLKDDLN